MTQAILREQPTEKQRPIQSKLEAEQVKAIRRALAQGASHRALAEEYKVGRSSIASIHHRRSWAYLED